MNKWQATKEFESMYFVIFILCSPVVIYFVGTAFSDLSDRIKTQNLLMLPASTLEKLLVQFVVHFLLFIPVALAAFWSMFYLAKATLFTGHKEWQLQSNNYDNLPAKMSSNDSLGIIYESTTKAAINYQSSNIPDFHFNMLWLSDKIGSEIITKVLFLSLFVIFAGTLFFKRFALIKTILILMILIGTCFIGMYFYDEYLISLDGSSNWQNGNNNYFHRAFINYPVLVLIWAGIGISLLSGFSYFKLKEKEA